nr:reverse transcriptase domain-containing protein [Tanacetum cinerariifolium]
MTVITNDENELVPTRLVTGWRVCIDYRKLNEATRKDHFPLPFMDQMLERLAGNESYCFLDGFSGYFQIPINPKDQTRCWKDSQGMNLIVSSMAFPATFRFPSTQKTKKKPRLHVPMELLLTSACRLASAMHMELSRDA